MLRLPGKQCIYGGTDRLLCFADCPPDWTYFNGKCYRVISSANTVTWLKADKLCIGEDATLASVHSENEMKFLHYLLMTGNMTKDGDVSFYIGWYSS